MTSAREPHVFRTTAELADGLAGQGETDPGNLADSLQIDGTQYTVDLSPDEDREDIWVIAKIAGAYLMIPHGWAEQRDTDKQSPGTAFNPAVDWGMADWARTAVALGHLPDSRIPANAVYIVKLSQPICKLQGCTWAGGCLPGYQEANDQRQQHLDRHRAALAWARGD